MVATESDTRTLSTAQLETFHEDYVSPELFDAIAHEIEQKYRNRPFSFLDVGGGQGFFTDRLIARFPLSSATLVDNAQVLLDKNAPSRRKRLVLGSATELTSRFGGETFDIIFFNLSLHHFVGNSYAQTRRIQRDALAQAKKLVHRDGCIAVTENLFDGLVLADLPGYLIYRLTSNRTLAPVIKRLGANTAGCGVCFLSTAGWRSEFRGLGLQESAFKEIHYPIGSFWSHVKVRLLTVRSITRGVFWLA